MERRYGLIVTLIAVVIYIGCAMSPPNLMDDVDAVQAQIGRNMLESGDWVTARLNGVAYLEKSPLIYWMMAVTYAMAGVTDWAARLPLAISVVLLAWTTWRFGKWAFGALGGFYAGLALTSSIGLFLFTRIQIPDAILTLTIAITLWGFLRALEGERRWAAIAAAAMGVGVLLKALIAIVFPMAAMVLYLLITGKWRKRETWSRLHLPSSIAIVAAIAMPWHVLATLRNPPYLDFTWRSAPGEYHGFFWFYFLNEHVFRFLNMRYPRDYNTVPRALFWALHLVWLFPWSGALAALPSQLYREDDRASHVRLLCLCWAGFILIFFSFSTTQEYYTLPAYPAFALLIGSAIATGGKVIRRALQAASFVFALAAVAIFFILTQVWNLPAEGDISRALTSNPDAYTLSMGHMGDLTIASFAYLKTPLVVALAACLAGALARGRVLTITLAMVVMFHAARLALIVFDPYLGSRELAIALRACPKGEVIVDNQYYAFSSVFFYADVKQAWLLNGRVNNLAYGSYAAGAPNVFLDDAKLVSLWRSETLHYIFVEKPRVSAIRAIVGADALHLVRESGGKYLFSNHPLNQQAAKL